MSESKSQLKRRVVQQGPLLADVIKAQRDAKLAKRADKHVAMAKKSAELIKAANREAWLERGVAKLTPIFKAAGHELPPARVSCSWPGGGSARKRIGECWPKSFSKAGINEIFISPLISDSVAALDILTHELVHAVDNCEHGHKKEFTKICKSIGMTEGKPTNVRAGEALRAQLVTIAASLGDYPHAQLDLSKRVKKSTYLIKCECANDDCGAVWRMTTSWIDRSGEFDGLKCPVCGESAQPGDTEESDDE